MIWVSFWDMHSGGGLKEPPFEHLYLRSKSREHGIAEFKRRFHHDPEAEGCSTCGQNYSIDTDGDLRQLTGYHRGLRFAHPKPPALSKADQKKRGLERRIADMKNKVGVQQKGRYLEPEEAIPDGWEVDDRYRKHGDVGLTLNQYVALETVYCDLQSDLEYLAKLEDPP